MLEYPIEPVLHRCAGLMRFVLERLIQQVGSQLQESQQQADAIMQRAAAVIEGDPRVRSALGGATVRVSRSPTSQSSSTMYVNGRRSAEITLLLPVASSSGTTAMAQVLPSQSLARSLETPAVCMLSYLNLPCKALTLRHAKQVTYQEDSEQTESPLHIVLQTDRGRVIELDRSKKPPPGPDVIDVDWREVR